MLRLCNEQTRQDALERAFDVRQAIDVPEAQDPESLSLKVPRALFVVRRLEVLAPVHLDDQSSVEADEVCEVRSDRMLSPEAEASEPSRTEVVPETALGVC